MAPAEKHKDNSSAANLFPQARLLEPVRLGGDGRRPSSIYILPWIEFRHIAIAHHKAFLSLHGGIRPKKWDSLHCAVAEAELAPHRDKWEVVEWSLG